MSAEEVVFDAVRRRDVRRWGETYEVHGATIDRMVADGRLAWVRGRLRNTEGAAG